jgi:hypothetical protein
MRFQKRSHVSRWVLIGVLFSLFQPGPLQADDHTVAKLSPLPPGINLPVTLETTLNRKNTVVGHPITAVLSQRVLLGNGNYLTRHAKLEGKVVSYDGGNVGIAFDKLGYKHQTAPISVSLVAAAWWTDVLETMRPVGSIDRATSNPNEWNTRQIGGDAVYRNSGQGDVYSRYSDLVGYVDAHGVFAAPLSPGAIPLAMGPFSTDSAGLYGMQGFEISSAGGSGAPIVFRLKSSNWQLHAGDALLLRVAPPQ